MFLYNMHHWNGCQWIVTTNNGVVFSDCNNIVLETFWEMNVNMLTIKEWSVLSSTQCVIIFYVYSFMIHYYVWSNLKINWKTKTFEHTVMFSWFNVFRITILNSIVYIPRIYDNKVTTLMHANTLVDISIIGCVQQYIFCFATLSIYVTSPNSSFNEKELFFISLICE